MPLRITFDFLRSAVRAARSWKQKHGWLQAHGYKRRPLLLAGCAALFSLAFWLSWLLLTSAPFRLEAVHVEGLSQVGREHEILAVFKKHIGSSLASVDLAERRGQILQIPWVRNSSVSRVWPNRILVLIEERKPVAFVLDGETAKTIDGDGMILEPRIPGERTLPLLIGVDERMPIPQRRRRTKMLEAVLQAFADVAPDLGLTVSEIDISDHTNAVALLPHEGSVIEVQFGDRNFTRRLEMFLRYRDAWKSEFGPIESVDVRYEEFFYIRPLVGKEEGP